MKLELRCEKCSHLVKTDMQVWLELAELQSRYNNTLNLVTLQIEDLLNIKTYTLLAFQNLAAINSLFAFFAKAQDNERY